MLLAPLSQAERVAAECGVSLPADLTALAASGGLQPGVLVAYIRYAQVGCAQEAAP